MPEFVLTRSDSGRAKLYYAGWLRATETRAGRALFTATPTLAQRFSLIWAEHARNHLQLHNETVSVEPAPEKVAKFPPHKAAVNPTKEQQ